VYHSAVALNLWETYKNSILYHNWFNIGFYSQKSIAPSHNNNPLQSSYYEPNIGNNSIMYSSLKNVPAQVQRSCTLPQDLSDNLTSSANQRRTVDGTTRRPLSFTQAVQVHDALVSQQQQHQKQPVGSVATATETGATLLQPASIRTRFKNEIRV